VAELDREGLIERFRDAFANGSRLAAFILAEELTKRGIPPCFRHHHLSSMDHSIHQRFDLLIYDLRWLRRAHHDHAAVIRFARCRKVFTGSDASFHDEATFMFHGGTRAPWKIVKSLRLTEDQQAECHWLRSAPVAKRLAGVQAMRERVFRALQADVARVRRTVSFSDADAKATLLRRHRLWLCRSYTTGGPSKIAARYYQLTGEQVTGKVVSRQLQIVDDTLRKLRHREGET
jgi:hypothetical protein